LDRYGEEVSKHQKESQPYSPAYPDKFLSGLKNLEKKDHRQTQRSNNHDPIPQDLDVYIRIAGSESSTCGGIEETKHLKVISPGKEEDNDTSYEYDVVPGFCGNIHFGNRDRFPLRLCKFIDDLKGSIFQVPPGSYQAGDKEKDQQPVLEEDVKGEGKHIITDVSIKNGVCGAKRFLVEIKKDRIPAIGTLGCNQKAGNHKKQNDEGIYGLT